MNAMIDKYQLTGKSYTFSDGKQIKVLQIKDSEHGPRVHYYQIELGGLERKLVLPLTDFMNTFGHLFGVSLPENNDPLLNVVYNGKPVTKL